MRHIILTLVALAFAYPTPAAAQASIYLDEMTWVEVRDAIKAGKTTVIIPTGGTEDFGSHMPMGTHNIIARHIAGEAAKRLGNALVAPTVTYLTQPDIHMKYQGTAGIPEEDFRNLVEWNARSLKVHGFTNIVLVGDHGTSRAPLKAVAEALTKEWAGTGVRVHDGSAFQASRADFEAWLLTQGEKKETFGPQAGLTMTSELLAINPGLVRKEKFANGYTDTTGRDGDPSRASEAYGRRGLDIRITAAVNQIKALIAAK